MARWCRSSARSRWRGALVAIALSLFACSPLDNLVQVGGVRRLRPPIDGPRPGRTERRPRVILIGLDGIGRRLLYAMLARGELPGFARLLGSPDGRTFPTTYFDQSMLSVLPAVTAAGWASVFSGAEPAASGVPGNEFFLRAGRDGQSAPEFVAPVPTSFADWHPLLRNYVEGYSDRLLMVPTVFERLRADEPQLRIWVSMVPFLRGADRLLIADRWVIPSAVVGYLVYRAGWSQIDLYSALDRAALRLLEEQLRLDLPVPDVLAMYLAGSDTYAHDSPAGPDRARWRYLREVLDPRIGALARQLRRRGALADTWIVITADHGFSPTEDDADHALAVGTRDPARVLAAMGLRVRPKELHAGDERTWQAVVAYQGAMAFVYLVDRATCVDARCNWQPRPRFQEDVRPVAEAFFRASNGDGAAGSVLGPVVDLVLVRRPGPDGRTGDGRMPFDVYAGEGRLVPVEEFLKSNPRPFDVALPERLRAMAVGPHGDRAGDLLLFSHYADTDVSGRYYFGRPHHAFHGSASRDDSEVPLIVAHPDGDPASIGALVRAAIGPSPHLERVTPLLLRLRATRPPLR